MVKDRICKTKLIALAESIYANGFEDGHKANSEDLKIEVTRIHKLEGAGPTKAFVDISISDVIIINTLRIIEGKDGLFVAMPREEGKDGKWYNIVVPLKREVKDQIEKVVLEAYGA